VHDETAVQFVDEFGIFERARCATDAVINLVPDAIEDRNSAGTLDGKPKEQSAGLLIALTEVPKEPASKVATYAEQNAAVIHWPALSC